MTVLALLPEMGSRLCKPKTKESVWYNKAAASIELACQGPVVYYLIKQVQIYEMK